MKILKNNIALAALTNQTAQSTLDENTGVAALTFTVGEIDPENPSRVQLFPDAQFKAKDGRPWEVASGYWLMDELAFQLITDDAAKRENEFHFDYEHQTLNAEYNGQPAPAAGWFNQFEYVKGEGLFAVNVRWTTKAKAHIKNDEYKFCSPVFHYDVATGRILSVLHAALTNDPALDGMKAVEALTARKPHQSNQASLTTHNHLTGEQPMNEAYALLLGLLGATVEGEDLSNPVALKAAQDRAKTAIAALKTKADQSGQLAIDLSVAQQSVAALKAQKLPEGTVPVETYNAMVLQVAALKNGSDQNTVEQLLKDNADKIYGAADRDYLEGVGKEQGAAALRSMLEPRVAIAALSSTQTKGKTKPNTTDDDSELNAEQIAVCKATGISEADFLAQLKAEGGNA